MPILLHIQMCTSIEPLRCFLKPESLLAMQLPVYEGPQQQQQSQQQQHPPAPTTPRAATGGGALPPPSPKDVESELLRTHMQVLSTYVDR